MKRTKAVKTATPNTIGNPTQNPSLESIAARKVRATKKGIQND